MQLTSQVDNIFTTLYQSKPKCTKRDIIHSLFNFLFRNSNSVEETKASKNNMAILKQNQDILKSQTQKTFIFINLTYVETDTSRLLLKIFTEGHLTDKQYCPPPIKRMRVTFP